MNEHDLSEFHLVTERLALRPSDMAAVEKVTGRSYGEIVGAGSAETFQAFAFVELRRRDRLAERVTDPFELWELAAEIDVVMGADDIKAARPDPLGETFS